MIKVFKNIIFLSRALQSLREDRYFDAYDHFDKIKTSNNTLKVKILLFKSFSTCFSFKNEHSVDLLNKALILLDSKKNFKKLSVDEIEYLQQYAYDLLKINYKYLQDNAKVVEIDKKRKDISSITHKIRKTFLRNFPLGERII